MAIERTFKIPRQVLMVVFNGDMQAVKAMENLQLSAFDLLPQDMADLIVQIEGAASQAEQAAILATQTFAIINQMIADNQASLQAVSVPLERSDYLQAVNVSIDCQTQLLPV